MKIYPGKWPIHFSTLLDLTIEGKHPSQMPATRGHFRFSGVPGPPKTPPPQRPEEELNLLQMCKKFTTKAGQGQLRTPQNQAENPAFFDREECPPPSPADDAKRSPRSGPVNQKINTPPPPVTPLECEGQKVGQND